jgi:hypothetical protein
MPWLPLLCLFSASVSPTSKIIPQPQEINLESTTVSVASFQENVLLDRCGADRRVVYATHLLREKLQQRGAQENLHGLPITYQLTPPSGQKVANPSKDQDESYSLTITPKEIVISAPEPLGLLWGTQTFLQLVENADDHLAIPCGTLRDWPAFPVRGLMHDVGRNFQSIEWLQTQLEVMSRYKLNTFHWHLTDFPAWRVESLEHPQLNDPKGRTRSPQQQYSQKEIRDFVNFAYARGITVIPEMDCPGHSRYFTKSLGFDMQTPQGLSLLKAEIPVWAELFPGPYFHLGSDEVAIKMPNFIPDLLQATREAQRQPMVWQPGAKITDLDVILQLWASAAIPTSGQRYIDSRWLYTNHMDPLEAPCLASLQVCGKPASDGLGLGAILCHWPDRRLGQEKDVVTVNGLLPQLIGFSEGVWYGTANSDRRYLVQCPAPDSSQRPSFENLEGRMAWHRDHYFQTLPFPFIASSQLHWKVQLTAPDVTTPPDFAHATDVWGGLVYLNHFWGSSDAKRNIPGWLPPQHENTTAWATTTFTSPIEQDVHLIIGFNTVSSSESKRGIDAPAPGTWSTLGHDVWVNGQRLNPPAWQCTRATEPLSESPMTDENWSMRPPPVIHLHAGENKILLKVPYQPKLPASWKWCFTCAPARWDGVNFHEVANLTFP